MTQSPEWRRARAQVLVATWLSYAGFYVCRKVFGVVKAPLAEALHVRDLDVAKLWTLFLAAYMVGQFGTAYLGRYLSCRALLLAGMAVTSISTLGMGALLDIRPSYCMSALGALLLLQGLAQATGWPGNIGLLSPWTHKDERGLLLSIWGTCYQLGSTGAKLLAAFLVGTLGLSWSFYGAGLVLFAICFIFYFWAHERPAQLEAAASPAQKTSNPEEQKEPSRAQSAAQTTAQIIRLAVALGLIYFCFKFLRYALDSWSALILARHFAQKVSTAGYLAAAFDLFGFLGVLTAGWLSDRPATGRGPILFAMTAGVLLVTVPMTLWGLRSVAVFIGGIALIGFLLMGPDSLLSGAVAMDRGGSRVALISAGVINGVGSIGPIVQEPLIGFCLQRYGLRSVFALLVVAAALGTVGTGLFWRWSRAQPKTP